MMLTTKQMVALGAVAAATALLGTQYLQAAKTGAEVSRSQACRALTPEPPEKWAPALRSALAPDFELKDVNGKTWSLASLRGKPVLLNFWATWCAPCAEEMPALEELARQLGDQATVLAVSVDESWDLIRRFFPNGTPLSILLDETKEIPKRWGTEKYPETFLIDADGRLRHYFVNKRKWDSAESYFCVLSAR